MLVPADEVVFHIFSAECASTVREAGTRASVAYERVVERSRWGRSRLRTT